MHAFTTLRPRHRRRPLFVALLVATLVQLSPTGQGQLPVSKVRADPAALEDVGACVAVDGDTAVVLGTLVDGQGRAFVIENTDTGWKRTAVLPFIFVASPWSGLHHGTGVAILGDTLFVAATGSDEVGDENGRVAIHQRDDNGTPFNRLDDTWPEVTFTLAYDTPFNVMHFGYALAVDGGLVLTGAPGEAFNPGRAYLHQHDDQGTPDDPFDDTWQPLTVLVPPGDPPTSRFGHAVALDGDLLVVGDPIAAPSNQGAVHTWLRVGSEWVFDGTLAPPGPAPHGFGFSLALQGGTLLVGHVGQLDMGEADFYRFDDGGTPGMPGDDAWLPDGSLQIGSLYADFGNAVALDGDRALISAVTTFGYFEVGGIVAEAARTPSGWELVRTFRAVDDELGDRFGCALSLQGSLLVVGAKGDQDAAAGDGAVWFLDLDAESPWIKEGTGLPWSEQVPRLVGWGRLVDNHDVACKLLRAREFDPAWLILGTTALFAPFKGGVLVPAPQIVLGPLPTNTDGHVLLEFTWPRDVPSGAELHFQWWLLEAVPFGGYYASPGLGVMQP